MGPNPVVVIINGKDAKILVKTAGKKHVMADRPGKKSVAQWHKRYGKKNLPWARREYIYVQRFCKGLSLTVLEPQAHRLEELKENVQGTMTWSEHI